jgi:HEPN domain-containing protein
MNQAWEQQWMLLAEFDLKASRNLVVSELENYQPAITLLQQATEKYLKAYYYKKLGNPIPKTHYLEELAHPLGVPENYMYLCEKLTEGYTSGRYPEWGTWDSDSVDQVDAKKILDEVEDFIQWIKTKI